MTAALDEVQRRLGGGLRGVATSEARIGAARTAQQNPTLLGVAGVVAAGAVAYGAYALITRGRRKNRPQVGENLKRGVELVREELTEGAERLEQVARGVLPRGVLLKLEPEDGGYVRVAEARLEPPSNKKRGRSTVIKKLVWAGLLSIFMAVGSVLARRIADAVWRAMVHEEPPTTRSKVAS
jgi:hypothetical protein